MATRTELLQIRRLRQQRKMQLRRRCALVLISLLVVAGLLFTFGKQVIAEFSSPSLEAPQDWGINHAQQGGAGPNRGGINAVQPGIPIPLLVNESKPLSQDKTSDKLVSLIGVIPVADSTIQVDESLVNPLIKMFAAAEQSGISDIYVNSAFRSQGEQEAIYRDTKDKSYVQKPGHSEHQTGLAVDIAVADLYGEEMELSKAGQWLAEHSWEYGFILRYPADKVNITGIAYEPWHFRYVGVDIAQYCFRHGLCLEEYVAKANGS